MSPLTIVKESKRAGKELNSRPEGSSCNLEEQVIKWTLSFRFLKANTYFSSNLGLHYSQTETNRNFLIHQKDIWMKTN